MTVEHMGSSHWNRPEFWAVVLAGGQGVRLQSLTRRLYGDARPKQYAALFETRSLLRQTLDRVRPVVPADRTLVVTLQGQQAYLDEALAGAPVRRVLVQPENKGTAAAALLSANYIQSFDPGAIMVVFPSDHFVSDDHRFTEHIVDVVSTVKEHPEWLALVAARPTGPEPEYGWIQPGEVTGWTPVGDPITRVRQFREKPSAGAARDCQESGWAVEHLHRRRPGFPVARARSPIPPATERATLAHRPRLGDPA